MDFEVKIVFAPYSAELEKKLNEACAGEWEPYGADGSFHYFRREKKEGGVRSSQEAPAVAAAPVFPLEKKPGGDKKKNK